MPHDYLRMLSMAHDIRGILSGASLYAEPLESHADPVVARRANKIATALERVIEVCQGELAHGLGQGKPIEMNQESLEDMFEEIGQLVHLQTEENTKRWRLEWAVDTDVATRCRRAPLFRILFNLIQNSACALSKTKGDTTRVDVSWTKGGMRLTISDNGPGLPESVLGFLYPTPGQMPKRTGRIGYGLMTSVRLADEMRGELSLKHSGPDGTVFDLMIPDSENAPCRHEKTVSSPLQSRDIERVWERS